MDEQRAPYVGLLPRFSPIPETRGFCDIFNPRNPGVFFQETPGFLNKFTLKIALNLYDI